MAFKLKLPKFKANSAVSQDVADKPLPLIGHLPFARQLQLLGGGVVLSFLVGVIAVGLDYRATRHEGYESSSPTTGGTLTCLLYTSDAADE